MKNGFIVLLGIFIRLLVIINTVTGDIRQDDHKKSVTWPSRQQELQDEVDDIKILKAVQMSMSEWKSKKSFKHRRKRSEKNVCYGDLGCFEDSGPFGYLDMLPSPPDEIATKFYIYSTKKRSDRPLLEFSFKNITGAWGNQSIPVNGTQERPTLNLDKLEDLTNVSTRIIVHGFGSNCIHVWIYELRTALMAVDDCIVICVDWERGATLPNYVKASANTRLVGKQLAMLLDGLKRTKNLQLSRTHIIGFSLGGHVAGFAGAETTGLKRITGLDPAGPLFESQHPKARLDSTDAEFVDVIHSNGENLILGGLGSWQPMGDVDFYPNGGRVQHGCSNIFVGALTDFIWTSPLSDEGRSLCNHRRAYKFFIDSVAPRCMFPAFPCESYDNFLQGQCFPCDPADASDPDSKCGNMGYYADRSTGRGQLYLVTREEEPFCAYQYNIEIHSAVSDSPLRTLGRLEVTLEGENGLNETFKVTEKDDTELFAGDIVSRIVVPHPALGFPSIITLTYKSYSGWLSKGLPSWKIYKIMLTDSYGKHSSICKRFFTLESSRQKRFVLMPGECHIPGEDDHHIELLGFPEKKVSRKNSSDYEKYHENIGPVYTFDENLNLRNGNNENLTVIHFGEMPQIAKNFSLLLSDEVSNSSPTWQTSFDENTLEHNHKNDKDASRSLKEREDQEEIVEPVLKVNGKRSKSISARESHALKEAEISEPILRSTTQRVIDDDDSTRRSFEKSKPRENGLITVQLLPFRLGEILDRAERYARLTLLPLITEQAPRFFGFDNQSRDKQETESAKYFPPLDDLIDESDLKEIRNKNSKRDNNNEEGNYENIDSSSPRNLLEAMRSDSKIIQARSIKSQPQQYYTNSEEDPDDDEIMKVVKIHLPTYKPPPSFPYPFEIPPSLEELQNVNSSDIVENSTQGTSQTLRKIPERER